MKSASAKNSLNTELVKKYERQLDDVMEIIDTAYLKEKWPMVELEFQESPTVLNKARLGIIYHEVTLNLSFHSKTEHKGYAAKSYNLLTDIVDDKNTPKEMLPFVAAYQASALSLVSAETKKLKFLGQAFTLFKDAVESYAEASYAPEFLRGSVAENLPWFFFGKRKYIRQDFQSIINKYQQNENYANAKIMSFTFWAWSNSHQSQKYRNQVLQYLALAIQLDPDYKGGRKKAEELLAKFQK